MSADRKLEVKILQKQLSGRVFNFAFLNFFPIVNKKKRVGSVP
jgi:hypothetical protein